MFLKMVGIVFTFTEILAEGRSSLAKTPFDFENLVQNDIQIAEIIREVYVDLTLWTTDVKYNDLKRHLSRYVVDYDASTQFTHLESARELRIAGNPILILRMLFRLVINLEPIEMGLKNLKSDPGHNTLKRLDDVWTHLELKPNLTLLETSMERLLQLVDSYELDLWQVVSGIFQNVDTGSRLDWRHCQLLSRYALKPGFHAMAVELAEIALGMALKANDVKAIEEIKELLGDAIEKHNSEFDKRKNFSGSGLFLRKIHIHGRAIENRKSRLRQPKYSGDIRHSSNDRLDKTSYSICSGQEFQSVEHKSKLICWYYPNADPWYQIHPLKVELLSESPQIFQIHDIVTASDANELIRLANSANFEWPHPGTFTTVLPLNSASTLRRLATKVQCIPKLNKETGPSETLELTAQTYGGDFIKHQEFQDFKKSSEDSDTTDEDDAESDSYVSPSPRPLFILYLNNVAAGGFTVFPEGRIGVKPKAGSAIITDARLLRLDCPVILGGPKWMGILA